ncbi:MAG: DegT/DnrJ/EryC1/StrS family aminotransferase [Bacillota bacterium]
MIPVARPVIGREEIEAVSEVLESGMLAAGKAVSRFEDEFSGHLGVGDAVATSSGTTALFAALWSLDLPAGTRVITTPFTFVASANAILYCGHVPVFCDIDPGSFNISPSSLSKLLRKSRNSAGALIVVHLYGQPCRMDLIMDMAREHGLKVIEDCAQSHGAAWRGKSAGTFGDIGVFSFYPTKNMTTGEGGMVVTDNPSLAEKIRMFINHGSSSRYRHEFLGHNFRMTDVAASIGLVQLGRLGGFNDARRQNARVLDGILGAVPGVKTPYVHPDARHVYHQYTIRCRWRDQLAEYLSRQGIGTGIHYPLPVHKQPLYKKMGYGRLHLPQAERACKEVLSLPVHPSLSESQLHYIGRKVAEFYEEKDISGHYNP